MLAVSTSPFLETTNDEVLPLPFNSTEYSSDLLQNLNLLFTDQCLCDVGLAVHPQRLIRAHRCVLSAASPYFHAMFNSGLRETGADVIDMQSIGAPHIIEKLLAFIYTGLLMCFNTSFCWVDDSVLFIILWRNSRNWKLKWSVIFFV